MTVNSITNRVAYTGNGTANPLAVSFPFQMQADLLVLETVIASGATTTKILNSDYTVTGTPDANGFYPNGGSVVPAAPIATTKWWTIVRDPPMTQLVQHVDNDPLPAASIDSPLDKAAMVDQRLKDRVDRSVQAPDGDPATSMILDPAAVRASFVTVFDSTGRLVPSTVSSATLEGFGEITADVALITAAAGSLSGDVMFSRPVSAIVAAPTGAEANGVRYIVRGGTGTFAGKSGKIAEMVLGVWVYSSTPKQGQKVYVENLRVDYIYRNTWWNKVLSSTVGAMYQDFTDVPDGTLINQMVLASGHILFPEGPGTLTGVVNNGRIEPTDNTYPTVVWPYKNFRMAMSYAWRAGHSGDGAVTLAAGRKVAGNIITKMIHTEYLYHGYGDMSIWGGPRQTPDGMGGYLGYLATAGLQNHRRDTDTNYVQHNSGQIQYSEMVVHGNNVKCHGDSGYYTDSYTDDMISGSVGDGPIGDGTDAGYLYFQTGGASPNSFLPYVYMIFAEPMAPTEDLPDPKFLPSAVGTSQQVSKSLAFTGAAQEVARATLASFTSSAFEVEIELAASGVNAGYASATRKYLVQTNNYGGTAQAGTPFSIYAQQQTSLNAGVIALSNTFTIGTSGLDLILYANPSRTGTDATAYSPLLTYTIRALGAYATFA